MWCLEALPRLEAVSRRIFHCLALGLDYIASVLLVPQGTNNKNVLLLAQIIKLNKISTTEYIALINQDDFSDDEHSNFFATKDYMPLRPV